MIPNLVHEIFQKFIENGYEIYLVGGFVRDALLGKTTNDIDFATNALPDEIRKLLGPSKEKMVYGSYHFQIENMKIAITTFRKDLAYHENKLTKFSYSSSLLEDAQRRDFTINAIYMNEKGEIFDPLNGQKDLKRKKISMIGDAKKRLKEDPIRILRAVRFSAVYHFELDENLKTAIETEKKHLKELPNDKIRKELDRILLADGFSYLKEFSLLEVLQIKTQKIVYVNNLAALWAQIHPSKEYVVEKNLIKQQKVIRNLLNCDTINLFHLYQYGYNPVYIATKIRKEPLSRIEKMKKSLVIHQRKEIAYSAKDIQKDFSIHGKNLGDLLKQLEKEIVMGHLQNDKESIKKFIEKRC